MKFTISPQLRSALALALTLVAGIALIVLLKVPGIIIALLLAAAVWLMSTSHPENSEHTALRTSISLSAEDIRAVMEQFEHFETSQDAEEVADRTIHRPALLDLDSNDPDIEVFHYQYAAAARYLKRLPTRTSNPAMSTAELEQILASTDQRAADLKEAWLNARRSAQRLGSTYKDSSIDEQ